MLRFQTRLMMLLFVAVDLTVTALAWILAYVLRFEVEAVQLFIPVTKGVPELSRYLLLLPFMAVIWPVVLYFHGLYQIKRGRSRIDEFFAILFSVLIGSALTLSATLYVRVYYRYQPEVAPSWEYSQAVFALFVVLDVLLLNAGRWAIRAHLERQWAAGFNVTRVLVAGTGDLGRAVAEALLAHRELGFRLVGFLADSPEASGHAGIPVVGYNAGQGPLEDGIDYLTYLGQDEYQGGYLGGLKLAAEGGTQGVCINQQVGHTGLDKRCAGFADALAEKGIPAEVLATVDDPAESQTIIDDYYTANPDTDTFLTMGPNSANPFYAFMEEAGLGAGDITMGTFDTGPQINEKIKDGTTMFGIDQQPFLQGYGAVTMLAMANRYGILPALPVTARDFLCPMTSC